MKLVTAAAVVSFLLPLVASADEACVYPQAPTQIPNGNTAAKEDMLAAQARIKEYSKNVQEVYLPCLQKEEDDEVAKLDPSDPDYAKKKALLDDIHAKKHNAALDELTALAARWSEEIRAFQNKGKQ